MFATNQFLAEENGNLNVELENSQEEISSLSDELHEVERDFEDVQDKVKHAQKKLLKLHAQGDVSNRAYLVLKKVLDDAEY
ncbi:hypothetical protein [Jeotgalicoccus marinus]|uniref:hypothetical protein n=1 Tax=Jeotgalicoccus marinus TaxID=516700 RepID=UPI00040BDBB5|nr:hypothetical protein [Jeotgalicoccus marinus]